MYPEKRQDETA